MIMDKNRIDGSIKQVAGATKVATGNAIGDAKLVHDGKVDQAAGKLQNAVGGVSDSLREAVKTAKE
jgi:uncharacterized protein YjbJ (UPF0337 family)